MSPSDKHHREHCSTAEPPAHDRDESVFDCDALLLESEREAELPYYVEIAGDYSIPHATTEHWGGYKGRGNTSAPRRNTLKPVLRRKSY
jgi:hypothetical protein